MRRTIRAGLLALLGFVVFSPAFAGSVGWRNEGTGCFPTATPPSEWSSDKNVLWKVALPVASYGAPIVVGDKLVLVSDPAEVMCVRRTDGKVLWQKSQADIKAPAAPKGGGKGGFGGPRGGGGNRSAGNSAATPVSDGKVVAAVFGNGVVTVCDLEGKRLWGKFLESPRIGFGHSASPLLIQGKLIVHLKDLVALDVATGKEVWRTELSASHASPVAARLGMEDLIISPAGAVVRASDGKILAKGAFRSSDNSPVVKDDTICVAGRGVFKLSQPKEGEVAVASLWANPGSGDGERRGGGGGGGRGGERKLPSPVVHDGLLYGVTTNGVLDVVDVKSGKAVYRQRLPVGQIYSSIALAGGMLYVLDMEGKAVVFKPGAKFERVAVNRLEGTGSCPVFAGDHLYVRGKKNLYCLSAKPAEKAKE